MPAMAIQDAQGMLAELRDILQDNFVQEEVITWLANNRIFTVAAFADLADDRQQIVDAVIAPAGLDKANAIACQPIRTAWRIAEATTKAALEARAKGEEVEGSFALSTDQRRRLDHNVKAHFNFRWPTTLSPGDTLLGKLGRFFTKKTRFCPRLEEVKTVYDRAEKTKVTLQMGGGGAITGLREEHAEDKVGNVWTFRNKHLVLMIAYVHAGSPTFDHADLTELLDYHEWLIQKMVEVKNNRRPTMAAVVQADFDMRAKWMMGYVLDEHASFMDSVKAYRAMSPVIFADIHPTAPAQPAGEHDGGKRGARTRKRAHARSSSSGDDDYVKSDKPKKQAKGPGKGKQQPSKPKAPCRFFNKGSCENGRDCKFAHTCDYVGANGPCLKRHARVDHHGRKDDRDGGRDRRR